MDIAKRFSELEESEKQLKELKSALRSLIKNKSIQNLIDGQNETPEHLFMDDLYARYGAYTDDEKKKLREHLMSERQVNYFKNNQSIYS